MKKIAVFGVMALLLCSLVMGAALTITTTPADKTRDTDGSVAFTATTDYNATGVTLSFGVDSYSMTDDGTEQSFTYTLSNIPDGTYSWYVSATNATNESTEGTSATKELSVIRESPGVKAIVANQQNEQASSKAGMGIGVIAVLGLAVYLGFIKKK